MLENNFYGLNMLPKHDGLEFRDPVRWTWHTSTKLPQTRDLYAKKVPEVVRWISFHP